MIHGGITHVGIDEVPTRGRSACIGMLDSEAKHRGGIRGSPHSGIDGGVVVPTTAWGGSGSGIDLMGIGGGIELVGSGSGIDLG